MRALSPGTLVLVDAAGNRQLTRRVAEDQGEIVLITTEEEYLLAQAEHRHAVAVGFRREWVHVLDEIPRKATAKESFSEARKSQSGD